MQIATLEEIIKVLEHLQGKPEFEKYKELIQKAKWVLCKGWKNTHL